MEVKYKGQRCVLVSWVSREWREQDKYRITWVPEGSGVTPRSILINETGVTEYQIGELHPSTTYNIKLWSLAGGESSKAQELVVNTCMYISCTKSNNSNFYNPCQDFNSETLELLRTFSITCQGQNDFSNLF